MIGKILIWVLIGLLVIGIVMMFSHYPVISILLLGITIIFFIGVWLYNQEKENG